uniref:HSF-type DNA-binding domain-containing protein n=1 Tax=Phytophthora ramorum TaxID=164328 RepID=H3H5E9_PHYRM
MAVALPAIATSFVRKLYRILDQESAAVIAWDADGASFSIHDSATLDAHILPRYFRGRLDSFRQQLREHSFASEPTAQGQERYRHRFFRRGRPDQLSQIPHSPLPRKRPPRRKKRKQEEAAITTAKIVKSSATRDVHRAAAQDQGEPQFRHAVVDDPAALAANPLFADDASLNGFVDGLESSVMLPVGPATDVKEEIMSGDVMEALLALLSTSLSTDGREATNTAAATINSTSSTGSNNLFAEGRPPVALPPLPPGIVENGQFSDDTLNNLMRWASANGTSAP